MIHLWQHIWLWFAVHTGTYNESGPYYGFFSGFGSDISEVLILGGVIQIYRKNNCHVKGCFRIAHHQVEGTSYKTCHKHATQTIHDALHKHHEEAHPEQHAFLNKKPPTQPPQAPEPPTGRVQLKIKQ